MEKFKNVLRKIFVIIAISPFLGTILIVGYFFTKTLPYEYLFGTLVCFLILAKLIVDISEKKQSSTVLDEDL